MITSVLYQLNLTSAGCVESGELYYSQNNAMAKRRSGKPDVISPVLDYEKNVISENLSH